MSDASVSVQSLAILQLQLDNLKAQVLDGRASDKALVEQQLREIRNQMVSALSRHETFAPQSALEKLESQIQARYDLLASKQDGIVGNINQLTQVLTRLTDEVSASQTASVAAESRGNERRNRLVAVIATATAVASLVFTNFIHHGGGTNTVYVPTTYATTTTTTHPAGGR